MSVSISFCHDHIEFSGICHSTQFITSNGGLSNASTGPSNTTYWFSITPPRLKEAISRLAACFHSPLFTPSVTSREIYAVDSENNRNLQDDDRRLFQLNSMLCSPAHPWSKFGCGSYASLTEASKEKIEKEGGVLDDSDEDGGAVGREIRRRVMEWREREYCAGRMTLAVLGKGMLP
jgi:insulysin